MRLHVKLYTKPCSFHYTNFALTSCLKSDITLLKGHPWLCNCYYTQIIWKMSMLTGQTEMLVQNSSYKAKIAEIEAETEVLGQI